MNDPHAPGPIVDASQDVSPRSDEPNAIQVLYNHPTDVASFKDYLFNVHVPLARKVPGVQHIVAHIGLTGMDQAPGDVYMIGTVVFRNQADLQSGLASDEGKAAYADLSNFATGGFTAYLSHVEFLA